MTPIINVQNLTLEYPSRGGAIKALHETSFSVEKGETVAIIGRSGGGKSSLLRALGGLIPAATGTITIADHIVETSQLKAREFYRDVGMVFQDYGLVPQLSALQNVLCGRLYDYPSLGALARFPLQDRVLALRYLKELGLGHRIDTRCSKLSGGEQQRVALARLKMQDPKVMLLDEPLSSLDVHWCDTVMHALKQAHEYQVTTLIVLHDLAIARKFADRVILVHEGHILFDGDVEEGCRRMEALQSRDDSQRLTDNRCKLTNDLTDSPQHRDSPPILSQPEPPQSPPRLLNRSSFYGGALLLVAALYIWAAIGVRFELSKVFGNKHHAMDLMGRMFPPDLSVAPTIAGSLVETIQMALIGTTLAAILSLPIAIAAARNLSWRPICFIARMSLNLLRTVPSIIWGLLFVAVVGLGPVPGILALTFYASGYLGKFYYEAIEAIDPRPMISLTTVGASTLQRFRYGVFPQVLPLFMGYTLYMFEYNLRAASILGIVGAGGIGFYLSFYITNMHYNQAVTALILLLIVVSIIDYASSRLRAWLN